jgi:PKD repeat protein
VNKDGYLFDIPDPSRLTASIQLTASSNVPPVAVANGSTDSDGNIVAYRWSFGDGQTADAADVTHTFTQPGDYQAVLTVSDDQEGDSSSQSISIAATNPLACNYNCLSVSNTALSTFRPRWAPERGRITAKVRVVNEYNQARQGATVYATWTLPDGTLVEQSKYIEPGDWKWFAELHVPAEQTGVYSLHIDNITADGYQFDPSGGNLEAIIVVSP